MNDPVNNTRDKLFNPMNVISVVRNKFEYMEFRAMEIVKPMINKNNNISPCKPITELFVKYPRDLIKIEHMTPINAPAMDIVK